MMARHLIALHSVQTKPNGSLLRTGMGWLAPDVPGGVLAEECSPDVVFDKPTIEPHVSSSPEVGSGPPEKDILDAICSKAVTLDSSSNPREIMVSTHFELMLCIEVGQLCGTPLG